MSARRWMYPQDGWLILAGANFLAAVASIALGFIAATQHRHPWALAVGAIMCGWFAFMCDLCLNRRLAALRRPSAGGRQP